MADILVLQAARFGDLVQSKRLVLSLGREGKAHLVIDRNLSRLAAILYPGAIVHAMEFHGAPDPRAIQENARIFGELSEINFSAIYNCNFSRLTEAVCRLFDPEKIHGYRPARNSGGGVERSPWARIAFRLGATRATTPLNLVDFWAWFCDKPISPEMVNPMPQGGGGGIGVATAGRDARRSLPPPVMANIIKALFKIYDPPEIKLLGTAHETPVARKIMRLLPEPMLSRARDLTGKTDWDGLLGALTGLDLLLTPDTGLMHLAAHLGVPVMGFFLSSALCHETGPYGKGHLVWQASGSCSPCLECSRCPRETACLEPFKDVGFIRALVLERSSGQPPELPEGLQLWRSGLDDLGVRFLLEAGQDQNAAKREALRALLRSWLGFPDLAINPENLYSPVYMNLVKSLFPDDEWMLPPARYC